MRFEILEGPRSVAVVALDGGRPKIDARDPEDETFLVAHLAAMDPGGAWSPTEFERRCLQLQDLRGWSVVPRPAPEQRPRGPRP